MLKTDGGWWTVARLVPCWRPTFRPHGVQQALDVLEAGSFIESRDQAGSRVYGVSPACEALPELAPLLGHACHEQPFGHGCMQMREATLQTSETS